MKSCLRLWRSFVDRFVNKYKFKRSKDFQEKFRKVDLLRFMKCDPHKFSNKFLLFLRERRIIFEILFFLYRSENISYLAHIQNKKIEENDSKSLFLARLQGACNLVSLAKWWCNDNCINSRDEVGSQLREIGVQSSRRISWRASL